MIFKNHACFAGCQNQPNGNSGKNEISKSVADAQNEKQQKEMEKQEEEKENMVEEENLEEEEKEEKGGIVESCRFTFTQEEFRDRSGNYPANSNQVKMGLLMLLIPFEIS